MGIKDLNRVPKNFGDVPKIWGRPQTIWKNNSHLIWDRFVCKNAKLYAKINTKFKKKFKKKIIIYLYIFIFEKLKKNIFFLIIFAAEYYSARRSNYSEYLF